MRFSSALPLLAAVLACASAAPAQSSRVATPLVPHAGTALDFRISLPEGWTIDRDDITASREAEVKMGTATNTVRVQVQGEVLSAAKGAGYVHLLVTDMVPVPSGVPVSWSEQRRMMTSAVLDSDSLLLNLMANAIRGREAEFRDVVREIRTLGGQRAGYQSAVLVQRGLRSQTELYATVKDGVMYVLIVAEPESSFAGTEPLFARVRDSLMFAENTPVSAPE